MALSFERYINIDSTNNIISFSIELPLVFEPCKSYEIHEPIIRKSNNLIGFFLLEDILLNNLIRFHLAHKCLVLFGEWHRCFDVIMPLCNYSGICD